MINKVLGMLGIASKAGKLVTGYDACQEAIQKKKIALVLIAEDTSERTQKNILQEGKKREVPILVYGTIEENSKAIGKRNKAIIGIKDVSMATQIQKMIDGGEFIG